MIVIDLEVELISCVMLEGEFEVGSIIVFVCKFLDICCGLFDSVVIIVLFEGDCI